eukprot:745285-Pyramimonas_sp.AAC.1
MHLVILSFKSSTWFCTSTVSTIGWLSASREGGCKGRGSRKADRSRNAWAACGMCVMGGVFGPRA